MYQDDTEHRKSFFCWSYKIPKKLLAIANKMQISPMEKRNFIVFFIKPIINMINNKIISNFINRFLLS